MCSSDLFCRVSYTFLGTVEIGFIVNGFNVMNVGNRNFVLLFPDGAGQVSLRPAVVRQDGGGLFYGILA